MEAGSQDLDFLERQPVHGQSLFDRLALGPLPAEEALQYAVEIGVALNKAHTRGMVHGYLCPRCVSVTANGAVVLAPPARPTAGNAAYRAPELVRGEQADSRTDVFAFGAMLYEMVAGTPAFPGEGQDLNRSILQDPAPTLTLRSPIYDAMASVISGCLEKNPAARRQRIQNAVIELRFAAKGKGRTAPPPPRPAPAPVAEPVAAVETPVEAPVEEAVEAPAAAAPPPALKKPAAKARPLEPPRAEQFFFKAGEPVPRMRPVPVTPGWAEIFGAEGKLSLQGFRFRLIGFIAICLVVVAGGAVGAVIYFRPKAAPPVMRFAVSAPEHTAFPGSPAVSPDGRNLAFSAQGPEGKRTLWLRPLDAIKSMPLAGTEGGTNPFWSPDGQYLAYFAARSLRTVRLKDLATETICKVEGMNAGGSWNKDGTIVFARGPDDGIYRVAAKAGSTPAPVLKVNATKSETGYLWPHFLPDDNHFIFYVQTDAVETTGVYGGTVDPPEYHMLFASETNAVYSALPDSTGRKNGYLLFIQGRKLMGQGFNAPRMGLAGEPMTLADDIGAVRSLSLAPISVANNATLVYQTVGKPTRRLVWFDRNGNEITEGAEAGEYGPSRISPDGRRAVVAKLGASDEAADLWTVDAAGKLSPLTQTSAHEGSPVWSQDGSKVAMFLRGKQEGNYDLYVMPTDSAKSPDLLFRSSVQKTPTDWSRDGRYIFFNSASDSTKWDVWAVSTADRHAGPILDTVNSERDAVLSPDGKWLAFDSDETNRLEVYVQAFNGINSENRKRWKVSTGGGATPKWSADGKELFYITGSGRIMSAAVRAGGSDFETDTPVKLFQTRPIPKTWNLFEVAPDGQRFLLNLPLEWANSSQIMVVTNWTEKLKE
jgi:Tol biopolymer transport system component